MNRIVDKSRAFSWFVVFALFALTTTTFPLFSEPFTSVRTAYWTDCLPWGCSAAFNHEAEYYLPANRWTVSGDGLDIVAKRQAYTDSHGTTWPYTSGEIQTKNKFSFLYGTLTVRFTVPRGAGLWPAIWMLAQNGQPVTELDALEVLGNQPNVINVGTHYLVNGVHQHSGAAVTVSDLSVGLHTLVVTWASNRLSWMVDGRTIFVQTDPTKIPQTPMYLILNLAVGGVGSWPGPPNAATVFPATFFVKSLYVTR